jgi:hypothetical protein
MRAYRLVEKGRCGYGACIIPRKLEKNAKTLFFDDGLPVIENRTLSKPLIAMKQNSNSVPFSCFLTLFLAFFFP